MACSHDATHISERYDVLSRRGALRLGGGAALAALVGTVGATTAAQEATDGEAVIAGEFVGAVRPEGGHHEDEIFVAIVADAPAPRAAQRRVRAYLCDGRSIDEWFVGEVDGNSATLSSEDDDAEFAAEMTADGVTGTFALAGGEPLAFTADRPTGRGGLYNVYIREDLSAFGASAGGNAYFTEIADDQARGVFLLANGTTEEAVAPVIMYPQVGEVAVRLIVLDDATSHMRGSTRSKDDKKDFWLVCISE
jgi:hypothetical protein